VAHDAPARTLARLLARHQVKLVLAESCTAGEAASQLGRVAGISQWWCGSLVVYRPDAKFRWLHISPQLVEQHAAESPQVSEALALAALSATPEADLAGAITGHLGPRAPRGLDGRVFVSVVQSGSAASTSEHQLVETTRRRRQIEAARCLLAQLSLILQRQ
jgi:PncC family amidohydrolase